MPSARRVTLPCSELQGVWM
uniref:Uncharacterized protein n=1 Tax=Arundo donax TaxID=35708 RepID=A0A0A9FB27_ARUDO